MEHPRIHALRIICFTNVLKIVYICFTNIYQIEMNSRLGHLEEMILLMIILVRDEVYGITVRKAFMEHYEQEISLSAVHTVLRRLEKKGYTVSRMGGASPERGGRRKRLYEITPYGYRTVEQIQQQRTNIWKLLPRLNF